MFGKVPAYTDISHFRAPYKNAYIAGYGQEPPPTPNGNGNGNGQVTNGNGAPDLAGMYVVTDERGYNLVKPAARETLMKNLASWGITFLGGPTNEHIIRPFAAELLQGAKEGNKEAKAVVDTANAAKFLKGSVANDQVVFGSVATLMAVIMNQPMIPEDAATLGMWPAESNEAKAAAKLPDIVVFGGDPDSKPTDWLMVGGVALAATAVVGGVYLLATRKKGY